jgi:hypothetical protein
MPEEFNATQYQPATLARLLTSIDVASNGRLLPGLGIGWSPDEYAAAGIPMSERGKRLDDLLDLLNTWWGKDIVVHEGVGYTIAESHVDLKPVRKPPVYLAGFGEKAQRRVAERADGRLPAWSVPEAFPANVLTTTLAKIRADAEKAGRDPQALGVALRVNANPGTKLGVLAESVVKIVAALEPDHTFVDLSYLAGSWTSSSSSRAGCSSRPPRADSGPDARRVFGQASGSSAGAQRPAEQSQQAIPMAPRTRSVERVRVGHREAVDRARVDLRRVADSRGVQSPGQLAQGLGRHVVLRQAQMDLGGEPGNQAVRAVGRVGDQEARVEPGDRGHPAGVGRRGAHRQGAADAVTHHRDRSGADFGLRGEEPEVGVGVAQDALGGVLLQQRHQPGDDRGPDVFPDVLGQVGHRGRAVAVVEVRDEHVVPVPGQFPGFLLQFGTHSERVRVQQHPRVPRAVAGERGESVGPAVGRRDVQGLRGHEVLQSWLTASDQHDEGGARAALSRAPGHRSVSGARPSR